ncbi:MAG: 5-carboxymethyl-2-hydroxymuconate Delta-isomerase [Alphaproteobacteria bacterium]|nr:5-carboxymethyl-2-hydroxymuconate Delta-isomerase [Alphaproteobacteria bacterium]
MPHIVAEYSANLVGRVDIPDLVRGLHAALAGAGVDETRIKTRAVRIDDYVLGGGKTAMIHVTLSLLTGRDEATRVAYGTALHTCLKAKAAALGDICALTLEVREMTRETYFL